MSGRKVLRYANCTVCDAQLGVVDIMSGEPGVGGPGPIPGIIRPCHVIYESTPEAMTTGMIEHFFNYLGQMEPAYRLYCRACGNYAGEKMDHVRLLLRESIDLKRHGPCG